MKKKGLLNVVAAVALLLSVTVILPVRRALAAPQGSRYGANYFPNIELVAQNGQKLRFYDDMIKDKIVVIDFIYTHCKDMCPLETARLAQVQKMLGDRVGKDIYFYSISIEPTVDTPEILKAYAEKFHAGSGWLFLTGKKEEIELLSEKLGMAGPSPESPDGHMPMILLGDEATGEWQRNAANDNPRFIATLIEKLGGYQHHSQEAMKDYANVPTIKLTHKGQYLFSTRCSACHTIGHGDLVGPDLGGVTNTRSREWLTNFIYKPDEMLAAKDPTATALYEKYKEIQMPNVRLGPEDVQSIIEYLAIQDKAKEMSSTARAVTSPATARP